MEVQNRTDFIRKLRPLVEYAKHIFRAIVYKTPAEIVDWEKARHNARWKICC